LRRPSKPKLGYEYIGETYTNLGEILTPEELAERLKVSVAWITEKRRPRCPNPIPALPIGKQIRFDWDAVIKWLEDCAAADAKNLQERRTKHVPQRRKPSKNVITFPDSEDTDETTPSKRKHRQA
jgi:Helix-turn-helix domain